MEGAKSKTERSEVLNKDRSNTAKCIINLVTEITKEQLIRYVLTVFDDILQVYFFNKNLKIFLRKTSQGLKFFMNTLLGNEELFGLGFKAF